MKKRRPLELLTRWGEGVPSEITLACERRKRAGLPLLDLVNTSVQRSGFEFDQTLLAECMAQAVVAARYYAPDPQGNIKTREAIAAYHGGVAPSDIVLTPGSSLGYYYAFRLLTNPGDEVLCPCPTYPLFDDLAFLAGVRVRRYYLSGATGGPWRFDAHDLEFQITPHTRALVLVSPHNPTGMVIGKDEMAAIANIAARHRLPIIFDEVFREFTHIPDLHVYRPSEFDVPLCLTLNGFSKMFSLPGMKIGWIVAEGRDAELKKSFINALTYTSDTFLPVQETAQAAAQLLLARGMECCRRAAVLYTQRSREMCEHWLSCGWRVAAPEAGPYLILDSNGALPTERAELEFVLRLIDERGLIFHPGHFYSLPVGALVCTAIAPPPWPDIRPPM